MIYRANYKQIAQIFHGKLEQIGAHYSDAGKSSGAAITADGKADRIVEPFVGGEV